MDASLPYRPLPATEAAARLLRGRANRHAWLGLGIALGALVAANVLATWYAYGDLQLEHLLASQRDNPALWLLAAMPLLFLVWGQHIGTVLAYQAGALMLDQTQALHRRSDRLQQQLERTPVHGPVLGLPNRHGLTAAIETEMAARSLDTGGNFAVLAIDTAEYEALEPAHNPELARAFLVQLRDRLLSVAGASDVLAYLGFDDFALRADCAGAHGALRLAHRIQLALETPLAVGRRPLYLRARIGIACYPDHGADADTLLRHAESARDAAAAAGSDVLVYEPAQKLARGETSRLLAELHAALEIDALVARYALQQPLAENLRPRLRLAPSWPHPRLGTLEAEAFVDLPDRSGLAQALSLWLLRVGLDHLAGLRRAGQALDLVLRLPSAAVRDPQLSATILRMLSAHDLPAQALIIELPEAALRRASQLLPGLRMAGVRIALADVGAAGVSPLAALDAPIDEARLDPALVARAQSEPAVAEAVVALRLLLRRLHLQTVSPGSGAQLTPADCGYLEHPAAAPGQAACSSGPLAA